MGHKSWKSTTARPRIAHRDNTSSFARQMSSIVFNEKSARWRLGLVRAREQRKWEQPDFFIIWQTHRRFLVGTLT